MITRKEIFSILTTAVLFAIIITLFSSPMDLLTMFVIVFVVIFINVLSKKVIGFYLDVDIEHRIWSLKQWGIKKHFRFKDYVQAGIFVPLIIKFLTYPFWGGINWLASLTFDASGKVYRAAKRHGIYWFSEVTEEEMGWIASTGILASLALGFIGYMIGQETLAKISITYAFFNMIPIYDLDGTKIFFGSKVLWSVLAIVTSLAFVATFVVV